MEFSKLEIHGKTYEVKDSGARELIEGLDDKIDVNVEALNGDIERLDDKIDVNVEALNGDIERLEREIEDLPGDWAITVEGDTFTFVRGGTEING